MFARIHSKLGTAGLVVAVVALVAALAGGAFAATGLTKQQEKQVKKIAKKFAGKQGPQGAQGPTGPTGPKGDPGAAGSAGKNGESVKLGEAENCVEGGVSLKVGAESQEVCNGEKGSMAETLPSGETEKGLWSFNAKEVGGSFVTITFQMPVNPAPTPHWIGPGDSATTECPGTVQEPKAKAGNLCIYGQTVENAGVGLNHAPEVGDNYTVNPQLGKVLEFANIPSETEGYGWGSWAVTAP